MNRNFSHKRFDEYGTYRSTRTGRSITPIVGQFNRFEFFMTGINPIINNPSGTVSDFQTIIISIRAISGATLTWGDKYRSIETLPTTATANKFLTMQFTWRSYDQKWHLLSSALEA